MLAAADLLLRLRLSGYLTSCCSGVALPLWPVWVCPSRWVVHLGAGFLPVTYILFTTCSPPRHGVALRLLCVSIPYSCIFGGWVGAFPGFREGCSFLCFLY